MKASELRIGNLVNEYKETVVVTKNTFKIWDEYNLSKFIKPIPLTEEWLVKFGFEYKEMYYQSKYLVALNDCFIIAERVTGLFYVDAPNNELKHVHQLQNLYFALTCKELTLQP